MTTPEGTDEKNPSGLSLQRWGHIAQYIVRHAERLWNESKQYLLGQTDMGSGQEGRGSAQDCGTWLAQGHRGLATAKGQGYLERLCWGFSDMPICSWVGTQDEDYPRKLSHWAIPKEPEPKLRPRVPTGGGGTQ